MVQSHGGRSRLGKVRRDIRSLYSSEICKIERAACPILADTRREWWDQACGECEKIRVEHLPEIGPWTRHILQLRFELEECGIPYGVDDLSPDEWHSLGIVSEEMKAVESGQKRKMQRKMKRLGFPLLH